jgi:hypothetical protein
LLLKLHEREIEAEQAKQRFQCAQIEARLFERQLMSDELFWRNGEDDKLRSEYAANALKVSKDKPRGIA